MWREIMYDNLHVFQKLINIGLDLIQDVALPASVATGGATVVDGSRGRTHRHQ